MIQHKNNNKDYKKKYDSNMHLIQKKHTGKK